MKQKNYKICVNLRNSISFREDRGLKWEFISCLMVTSLNADVPCSKIKFVNFVLSLNCSVPMLVSQELCREVPREVCQTVFANPRNFKVQTLCIVLNVAKSKSKIPFPNL